MTDPVLLQSGASILVIAGGPPGPPGATGDTGAVGADGPTGDTGPTGAPGVGLWRGEYAGATAYSNNDLVQFEGSVWLATASTVAVAPPTTPGGTPVAPWQLVAARGDVGPAGEAGEVGEAGEQGPPGDDGAIGLTWRAAWSSATAYVFGDAVARLGAAYIATAGSTNAAPESTPGSWDLLAAKGDPGAAGADGADGTPGADGEPGTTLHGFLTDTDDYGHPIEAIPGLSDALDALQAAVLAEVAKRAAEGLATVAYSDSFAVVRPTGWAGVLFRGPAPRPPVYEVATDIWIEDVGSSNLTLGDSIGITDSVSATVDAVRSMTDTIGIADSVSTALGAVRSLTDVVGITDSIIVAIGGVTSLTDVVGITDSVSTSLDMVRIITDTVGITDSVSTSVTGIGDLSYTITDSISITDSGTQVVVVTEVLTDVVGIDDSVIGLLTGDADLINLTDSIVVSLSTTGSLQLESSTDSYLLEDGSGGYLLEV